MGTLNPARSLTDSRWYVLVFVVVQRQDVTVVSYQLVHWEDAESLRASTMNIVNGCKEGPLLYKTYHYGYMFTATPAWTQAHFVLK